MGVPLKFYYLKDRTRRREKNLTEIGSKELHN